MNRFRVLMMLTALLATAAVVHAQTPPYEAPNYPKGQPEPQSGCPAASWYSQALQGSAATWQRLRAVCSSRDSDATCETANAPACVFGVVGSVKGCEVAQAPKGCCCAKACACCESCKVKPGILQPDPQSCPMAGAPNCLTPQCGSGIVQIAPVQGVRVQVVQVAHAVKPARLVTPDLEAICERMHHRGDVVVLEGNVLLLCKKHAQPIRIEAQRVLVNMRDGSFSVESDARPVSVTPTTFRVLRTSHEGEQDWRIGIHPVSPRIESPRTAVPAQAGPSSAYFPIPATSAVPTTMTPEMLRDLLKNFNFGGIPY